MRKIQKLRMKHKVRNAQRGLKKMFRNIREAF